MRNVVSPPDNIGSDKAEQEGEGPQEVHETNDQI